MEEARTSVTAPARASRATDAGTGRTLCRCRSSGARDLGLRRGSSRHEPPPRLLERSGDERDLPGAQTPIGEEDEDPVGGVGDRLELRWVVVVSHNPPEERPGHVGGAEARAVARDLVR